MAGLFADPNAVAIAEQEQRQATADPRAAVRGALFNLGNTAGDATVRGFGGDSRSPQVKRAQLLQNTAKGIDFKSQDSIFQGMNRLNELGFQAEALKLGSLIQTPGTAPKTFGPQFKQEVTVTDPDSGNKTKKVVYGRNDSLGGFKQDFSITSSGELDTGSGTPLKLNFGKDEARLTDETKQLFMGRLTDVLNNEYTDGPDAEDLMGKGFEGQILKMSDQARQGQVMELVTMAKQWEQENGQPMDQLTFDALAKQIVKPNSVNAEAAFDSLMSSNEYRKFVTQGLPLTEPTVSPSGTDNISLEETQELAGQAKARRDATLKAAENFGNLVKGDRRLGEFNLRDLSAAEAAPLFDPLFKGASDEQMFQNMEAQGLKFTPQMRESHAIRWQAMRENPEVSNIFFYGNPEGNVNGLQSAADDGQREDRITQYMDELEQRDTGFQKFATSARLLDYLRRATGGTHKAVVRGRDTRTK